MLVLKRSQDEQVTFELPDGQRITVKVITARAVKLGIEAPPEVKILRDELITPQQPISA